MDRKELIKHMMTTRPDLGAPDKEQTLFDIIEEYYRHNFGEDACNMALLYIDKLTDAMFQEPSEQHKGDSK